MSTYDLLLTNVRVVRHDRPEPELMDIGVTDGRISRVAPQMNVFSVGFTVKIGVGLLLLGMTLPYVAEWMDGHLQSSVADALRTIRVA